MTISRRDFIKDVLLAGASLAVPNLAFAQSERIPIANPEMQGELDALLKGSLKNAHEAPTLNLLAQNLMERLPDAVPAPAALPPYPKVYVYDSDEIASGGRVLSDTARGSASAIVLTQKARDALSIDEARFAAAHAIGEMIIAMNPDLVKSYHLPGVAEVDRDVKKLKISRQKLDDRLKRFTSGLLADDIAIRLTRDPAGLESYVNKAAASRLKPGNDEQTRDPGISGPSDDARIKAAYRAEEELHRKDLKGSMTRVSNEIAGLPHK